MLVKIVTGLIYVGLPLVGLAALAPEESTEFDGQSVTDFALQAPDGDMVGLRNFRGFPVIVEFFATWCPTSRAQLNQLTKLHDKYADHGLAIFAFAVDPFEHRNDEGHGPLALNESTISGQWSYTPVGRRLPLQGISRHYPTERRGQNRTDIFWLPRDETTETLCHPPCFGIKK